MEIIICDSIDESAHVAAKVVGKIVKSVKNPVLGLATGGTPFRMYQKLIKMHHSREISFKNCSTFNLDEYSGLTKDDERSYYYYMMNNFFEHVDIDKSKVNIPDGNSKNLRESCRHYEQQIKDAGGIDIQVLGIGANGHIGFNEPTGSFASRTWVKILSEQTIRDNSKYFEKMDDVPRHVVTMGIATIMESRHCMLLANGSKKADAVKKMIEGPISASCPASILQMHPRVTVVLDEEAAYLLTFKDHYKWVEKNKLDWQNY